MLPFNLVIRDPTDTYFTFGALLIFGTCMTMYLLAREFTGRIGATAAALLFAFSQLFLLAYWYEGNLGRATAAFLAPLAFMFGYRVLRLASARSFVALALSTGGLILAHSMQGLMFLMLLGLFLLGASLVSEKRLAGLVRVGASVTLGAGLSLFWFLPSISHFDLANVPKLFTEKIYIYSVGFDIFDTWNFREDVFGVAYFGVPVVAAAMIGVLASFRRGPRGPLYGLVLAMVAGIVLSLGTNLGSWYASVPIFKSLLPLRFMLAALLPAALLGGMAAQTLADWYRTGATRLRKTLAITSGIAVLGLLVWDYLPGLDVVRPGGTSSLQDVSTRLDDQPVSGRVLVLSPEGSATSYWPTVAGQRRQAFGWAVEGTIQNEAIPLMNQAIRESWDEYLAHLFALWNVDLILLGGDSIDEWQNRFAAIGYQAVDRFEAVPPTQPLICS